MKLVLLSISLALMIFIFDLMVPLGIAGGVPYVAVVLLGIWYPKIRHIYILAELATILTIAGFFLSPPGGTLWVVMTNRGIALFSIWITAFLIAKWMKTEKELRDKEAELRHISRLSDMGQMASSLAHEINQPLTAIGIYIQAARRTLENKGLEGHDKAYENLEKSVAQADRASQIITRLRHFISKGEPEFTGLNINDLIEDTASLTLTDANKRGIKVKIRLDRQLPEVFGDRVQIQQVIVNLIRNSLDTLKDSDVRELSISSSIKGNLVYVTVEDTGPGIPPEIAEKLFQPFVTSKPDGMGEPSDGKGTIFHFTLPRYSDNPF